jgi:hypothetical protein
MFEVIEIITIPENVKDFKEIERLIISREVFWMNHYDSISNGYNSVVSDKNELKKIVAEITEAQ